MFKMVAILAVVAGGAGYGLYAHTDLFGSKSEPTPVAKMPCCTEGNGSTAIKPSCCQSGDACCEVLADCCTTGSVASATSTKPASCCATKTATVATKPAPCCAVLCAACGDICDGCSLCQIDCAACCSAVV